MTLTVNKIISSALEILLLGVIPFVWWFVTARKKVKFTEWIGLKKIGKPNRKGAFLGVLCVLVLFIVFSVLILYMVRNIETATSEFKGLGIAGLLPALIYAVFNTSFPEELFFRGFLHKRLASKFGYMPANIVQSILFGLIHGAMFFSTLGFVKVLFVVAFTGGIAFAMAYINERKADGSIFPSWIIHAGSNIAASIVALFSLI